MTARKTEASGVVCGEPRPDTASLPATYRRWPRTDRNGWRVAGETIRTGSLARGLGLTVAFSCLWLGARSTASGPLTPVPAAPSPPAARPDSWPAAPMEQPPAPHPSSAAEPIERQAYRIAVYLACHPSSRIDEARRADLLHAWQVLARRFVGAPWSIDIAPPSSSLPIFDLDHLDPSALAKMTAYDKVWIVHAAASIGGSALAFSGREYDTATRRLGPLKAQTAEVLADAPRALLRFTLDLFSPTAMITGQEGGRALLTVRGARIEPASPVGAVVSPRMVFQPLRLVSLKSGETVVRVIPWTYLQVESIEGAVVRCALISAFRDPLTQRVSLPNTLAGVGLKPGKSPLRLQFVTQPDKRPAAGYTLIARPVPDGPPRELGMTDRGGRIVLPPGFSDGLVILRLLAGNVEPMVERPVMPGETEDERVIAFNPLPMTVALEAQVDSLRDEVVDLVALRARLEARMKARLEGEDWAGLQEAIQEFFKLSPRDDFAKRLTLIKDEAARHQAETKQAILTKTAQAQINDLQSLIDRYLDDETINAYREALERGRGETAAKEKARAKAKALATRPVPPLSPTAPTATRATPIPTPAAPAQPQPRPRTKPEIPKGSSSIPF